MALNLGSAIAYLELDTSKFRSGFSSALSDLKSFTSEGATVTQKLTSLQSAFSTFGGGLTKGVTLPLVGVGTAAVKMATDFEKQMSEVQAISQASGSDFDRLKETAMDLGASTAFSASEVAAGMTEMAKAGWDTDQIISGMGGVLDAAAASGEDLASVSTVVADAVTGFGLAASDSTRVADLLTQAANGGTIGINDLAESYKYISPIAKTMGFSIEDVTTAITALSTAGIKGSQAGTSLRTMLSQLNNPSEKVAAAMDELGIDIADAEGNFYSLDEILSQMRSRFKELTPEQQAYYANVLAGREGMSGLNAILSMSQEEYDKIAESMDNADGVAQKTAETMQDNLAGAIEQLGGAFETAAITIGDRMIPYIRQLAEWITGLVDKFNNLSDEQQDMIVKFGLIAAAVGPVLLILSKIIGLATTLGGAFMAIGTSVGEATALVNAGFTGMAMQAGIVGKAVALIKDPINAIVNAFKMITTAINPVKVAITVLVAAFMTLWNTNEGFRSSITNTWNSIKLIISGAIDEISEKLSSYGITFEGIIETITNLWTGFCNIIAPLFTQGFEAVMNIVQGLMGVMSGFVDIIGGVLTGNFDLIMQGVNGILSSIVTAVTGAFANLLQAVGQIGANLLNALGFESAAQVVQNFYNQLSNVVRNLPTMITQLVQSFSTTPSRVKSWLDKTINNVKIWATNLANNAKQAGTKFVNNVSNSIKQIPSKIKSQLDKAINSVKTWASNMVSNAKSAGSKFINGVTSALRSLPSNIASVLSNVISKIASWASQLLNKGRQAANNLKNGIVNTAKQIPSQMVSIGSNIVNGVWQGIQNAAGSFISKVTSFFKGVVNSVKGALGIHSPSTVFDKQIGQNIVKGVIKGVDKQKKNAKKSAKELSKLYVEAAEEKLNNMKEVNDISVKAEMIYWKKIKKETKKGSAGYKQANREVRKLRKQLNEELKQLNQDYANDVAEVKKQLLSDIKDVTDAYDEAVASRQQDILSSLGLFDAFESETENTKESLMSNLQGQVDALNEWANLLTSLEKRGIGEGLLTELEQMGVDSLADLKLLNSMTDTELSKYVSLWNQKNSIALTQAIKETDKTTYLNQIKQLVNDAGNQIDELEKQYKQDLKDLGVTFKDTSVSIGQDLINGISNGINSAYPGMKKELKNLCKKITTTVKKTLKISSPSKVFAELGMYTAEGFGVGFSNEMNTVDKSVKNQINSLSDIDTGAILQDFFSTMATNYTNALETLKTAMSGSMTAFTDGMNIMLDVMIQKLYDISNKMGIITDIWNMINAEGYTPTGRGGGRRRSKVEGGTTPTTDGGGDTYNFYNTKPDPYEYARQMKKAKKEMLYGY